MGYQEGGEVSWSGNPDEDARMISQHPLFKRLVGESRMYGYDPAELPNMILGSQLGRLFDTPEKQEALMLANAAAQAEGNMNYYMGGKVNYQTGGEVDPIDAVLAESGQSRYHYDRYGPNDATQAILDAQAAQQAPVTPAAPDAPVGTPAATADAIALADTAIPTEGDVDPVIPPCLLYTSPSPRD